MTSSTWFKIYLNEANKKKPSSCPTLALNNGQAIQYIAVKMDCPITCLCSRGVNSRP